MGQMKDLLITVYGGGDEAVAAVRRMGDDWRAQLEQAAAEVESLRLTDEEREAVEEMLHLIATRQTDYQREAHTLRTLLERLA